MITRTVESEGFKLARRLKPTMWKNSFGARGQQAGRGAADAIKCLGSGTASSGSRKIGLLMKTAKDKDRLVACCQTLGKSETPGIDPLERVSRRRVFCQTQQVSFAHPCAAAVALSFIHDPRALRSWRMHPRSRPQVRQTAASLISSHSTRENQ